MAVLTKAELQNLNPDKIYTLPLVLNIESWANIDRALETTLENPVKVKFDTNIRDNLGALKDKKGIYIFFIEPDFPFMPKVNYLMYVGRVVKKNSFFVRFYDYVSAIGNSRTRRNIQLLANLWPDKTWVYFYELDLTDDEISAIEKNLFDSIVPPLNNMFSTKQARNSRSIYN